MPGLPHEQQGHSHLSYHKLPARLCTKKSWNQEQSQNSNPGTLIWNEDIPTGIITIRPKRLLPLNVQLMAPYSQRPIFLGDTTKNKIKVIFRIGGFSFGRGDECFVGWKQEVGCFI